MSLTLVLCLAACNQKPSDKPTQSENSEKVRVTLWHTYTEKQREYLDKTIADFNASQEKIEVVAEAQPRQDFESKVMQAVRAGNGPDLIIHFSSEAANYVADGLVVDFAKYLDASFIDSIDAGAILEAKSFADGGMHLLPLFTSGPVLFYNTKIYEELSLKAPTTWEELAENSRKIKEAHPDKYGFAADSLADLGQTLFSQNGDKIIDKDKKEATFNTEANAASVNWYAEGVKKGHFMLSPSEQYFSSDFNSEVLATYIGSVAGAPYLTKDLWSVAPLPQGGKEQWTPAWNRGIIAFKSNEAREAATVEYAKYLASPEVNAGFCVTANYASPLAATREVQAYKDLIATNKPLAALRPEIAGSFPAIAGTSDIRKGIEKTFTEVSTGQKDAQQALNDAVSEANNSLKG